jgi:DNA-binding GntR family transcriptional regulator
MTNQGDTRNAVERVYSQVRDMAVTYSIRPGERLNEIDLAAQLGVSRTPLREALNRLAMEGLLRLKPGFGFYARELKAKNVFDLYELRGVVEVGALRKSIEIARDQDIKALMKFLEETGTSHADNRSTTEFVKLDEIFHERLMAMSNNQEMLRVLRNINSQIQFVRWIDMDNNKRRAKTQGEHKATLAALLMRDEAKAVEILSNHIRRRMDQITTAVAAGILQIYHTSTE